MVAQPLPATAYGRLDYSQFLWLVASLLLVIVPHLPRQPFWIPLCFVALIAWRYLGDYHQWPLPDRRHSGLVILKQVLAFIVFVGVFSYYGGRLGRDAGVSLLIVLLGLKLTEMRSDRDVYVLIFLGYFLIITNFFYSQTIPSAIYMLFIVLLVTSNLVALNDVGGTLAITQRTKIATRLVLQATPLMLALFVLFPRIPGPLWGLPNDARNAVTGLSDELSLGNITKLSLSNAVAFRAKFDGVMPPAAQRYWRGPVLWYSDGRTWTPRRSVEQPSPISVAGQGTRYTVTLEPHNKRWLFALDMPSDNPPMTRVSRDYRLLSRRPVTERIRYTVTSHTRYQTGAASPAELALARQLPADQHPQALSLAKSWRHDHATDRALVNRALRFFAEEPFYYTLAPPGLSGDTVDGFLFQTRRGFCEHYAAAFTILMRSAGIPARIVTGYQGGEYNAVGDYLVVRQRDAHAWVEVWLESTGWTRVDPTAAVSPARVELGIDDALPQRLGVLPNDPRIERLVDRVRNSWDAVNNSWNQWVLGYGPERQTDLASRLGINNPSWAKLSLWMVTVIGIVLTAIAVLMWWRGERRIIDPVRAAYDRFCGKLADIDITRYGHEGPLDFAARAAGTRKDLAPEIQQITRLYIGLRYNNEEHDIQKLKRQVHAFRATKRVVIQ